MVVKKQLQYAEYITNFLDSKFSIFGFKFGVDPFMNLVPFLGPLVSAVLSCYLLWIGYKLKISWLLFLQMIINLVVDYLIGLLPVVGIVGDLFFKANVRNLELLKRQLPKDIEIGEIINE